MKTLTITHYVHISKVKHTHLHIPNKARPIPTCKIPIMMISIRIICHLINSIALHTGRHLFVGILIQIFSWGPFEHLKACANELKLQFYSKIIKVINTRKSHVYVYGKRERERDLFSVHLLCKHGLIFQQSFVSVYHIRTTIITITYPVKIIFNPKTDLY